MKHEIAYFNSEGNVEWSLLTKDNGWDINNSSAWNRQLGIGFSWEMKEEKGRTLLRIPRDSFREEGTCRLKDIVPCQGHISGHEGDGGALVLPLDSGRLCFTKGKEAEEYWFTHFRHPNKIYWSNMSVIGQYAGGQAQATIIEGGKFDAQLRVRTNWGTDGLYIIDAVFAVRDFVADELLNEDLTMFLGKFAGDYRAIAEFYREYNLNVRNLPTLTEKATNNPDLDYSSRAMTIRCRMSVKPLPWQPEQTPENEPPVKVYMTFADIRTIADEFARQEVGPCEFCLVGWNHGGHDGAFPQLFPIEEACGGEAELRKTIEYVKSLGYPISFHDNYYDGYLLADNLDPNDICIKHDGELCIGGGELLAGGTAYRICAKQAKIKYAADSFKKISTFDLKGAYFVDVLSIIGMEKCYHEEHPLSRQGNAKYYKEILKMQQEYFKVSMSEGTRDWALPELDRAYMIFNCIDIPLACVDEAIPLFQIVYHGFLIYNNFREGVNTFPGSRLYLLNLAWGGLPLIYFHHLFNPNWKNGWANDLTFETPEKLSADTAVFKHMTNDISRLEHLRNIFISDFHWHGEELSETVFSNGSRIWTNYSSETKIIPSGDAIPASDFIVINSKEL